jgi:hypothetical protein
MQPATLDNQLMSKHRVLSFKPQLRLEWRGQDGQSETDQLDLRQLRRFHHVINRDEVFGTHQGVRPSCIAATVTIGCRANWCALYFTDDERLPQYVIEPVLR